MNSRIKILVNAFPMANVNTGIGRYLRCLYTEMERAYGDRLEIWYFDGMKISPRMPDGPANLDRWTVAVHEGETHISEFFHWVDMMKSFEVVNG